MQKWIKTLNTNVSTSTCTCIYLILGLDQEKRQTLYYNDYNVLIATMNVCAVNDPMLFNEPG